MDALRRQRFDAIEPGGNLIDLEILCIRRQEGGPGPSQRTSAGCRDG